MQTNPVFLACYKGKKTGWTPSALLARFADWATRKLTKGEYSHCEIAILQPNGKYDCYSSSIREGGVRMKQMKLPADKWDLLPLNDIPEERIFAYFQQTKGAKYDYFGAFGVVFGTKQARSKFFCSEWCFNAITGENSGWRFSPNALAKIV